jgi:hypothetical protein
MLLRLRPSKPTPGHFSLTLAEVFPRPPPDLVPLQLAPSDPMRTAVGGSCLKTSLRTAPSARLVPGLDQLLNQSPPTKKRRRLLDSVSPQRRTRTGLRCNVRQTKDAWDSEFSRAASRSCFPATSKAGAARRPMRPTTVGRSQNPCRVLPPPPSRKNVARIRAGQSLFLNINPALALEEISLQNEKANHEYIVMKFTKATFVCDFLNRLFCRTAPTPR